MKPMRLAMIATLFGVLAVVLTVVVRTGQVDVSSIQPTPAPTRAMATPTPRPVQLDITAFTVAMDGVEAHFRALAANTDLLTDESWRVQTLAIMKSAESEARALANAGHTKRDGLLKTAEALRVTRESLSDYDLIGMASGVRLLNDAAGELR